jgi:monofunctional biosynthetic peptidoglycan transglycosylase
MRFLWNRPLRTRDRVLLALAVLAGLAWFYWVTKCAGTPPVAQLVWSRPVKTAYMISDGNGEIDHRWVPMRRISRNLRNAVIIAEDDQFFEHPGYDWEAIKDAAEVNWRRGRFSHGASTITMQLARNLYLSSEKSILRKLKEILIALKLERTLSKERILEIYLNVVEWGNGVYGAEAAARHYFGKRASDLSRDEAAWLAAILPKPRYYDRHRGSPYAQDRATSIAQRL